MAGGSVENAGRAEVTTFGLGNLEQWPARNDILKAS